jgi:murein peptide amidase A
MMGRKTWIVGALALALAGCGRVEEQSAMIGRSVEGRHIEAVRIGSGPRKVLLIATIHGSEPAGTPLLRELQRRIHLMPAAFRETELMMIPIANPDGLARGTRGNARGVDLNRNLPAQNRVNRARWGNADTPEPESKALADLLHDFGPERIVSIHQPLACIDYDGPAAALARHMAEYTDLPVEQIGSRPGSLGSYAGVDLGIPIITLELRRYDHHLTDRTLWDEYGRALIAAVTFPEAPPHALFRRYWTMPLGAAAFTAAALLVIRLRRRREEP